MTAFVHHQLDFSKSTPMGFALCSVCGAFVTKEQWAGEQCPGKTLILPVEEQYFLAPGPACALCAEPLIVDPVHYAVVEVFGSVCNACAKAPVREVVHG